MQKILQRAAYADKQALRRAALKKARDEKQHAGGRQEEVQHSRLEWARYVRAARQARREDWELGPLAPKRDVGDVAEKYGAASPYLLRGPPLSEKDQKKALEPYGGKLLHFRKGDRVVMIQGRDKGKISTIREIDRERASVTVDKLNVIDVEYPKYMISPDDPDQRPIRSLEQQVPLSWIKLVYPLEDPETGTIRDVIIHKLANSPGWFDRASGTKRWHRIIPDLNIKIPWPTAEPVELEDHPCDTLRPEVETKTFIPSLLYPPMPGSVIDELRNKYSKYRTRHDEDYIARKEAEAREKETDQKAVDAMLSPLKQFNRLQRKMNKFKGKGNRQRNREVLAKVGEMMAQRQAMQMGQAGLELLPPNAASPATEQPTAA